MRSKFFISFHLVLLPLFYSLLFHSQYCDQNVLSKHVLDYTFLLLLTLQWLLITHKNWSWNPPNIRRFINFHDLIHAHSPTLLLSLSYFQPDTKSQQTVWFPGLKYFSTPLNLCPSFSMESPSIFLLVNSNSFIQNPTQTSLRDTFPFPLPAPPQPLPWLVFQPSYMVLHISYILLLQICHIFFHLYLSFLPSRTWLLLIIFVALSFNLVMTHSE